MAKRDFYDILGVGRKASTDEIKSAYRKAARKYHPDVNKSPDATTKFQQATEAYEVLSDPRKRKMYDQYGHAAPGVGAGAGVPPGAGRPYERTYTWTGRPPGGGGIDFEDIFGGSRGSSGFMGMSLEEILSALGGGRMGGQRVRDARRRRTAPKGNDVEYHLTLDFMQAIRGTTASVRLGHSGGGSQKLKVKIPPGVREGQKIRLEGKGQPGRGGNGDLFIVVHVGEHPYFRRQGNDIYVDVPVGIAEASLGAKVNVPTIDGMTTVKIPPGTSSAQKLRLAGKGAPDTSSGKRGDQYVNVKIVPPKKISQKGAELLKQFQKQEKDDPRSNAPWK